MSRIFLSCAVLFGASFAAADELSDAIAVLTSIAPGGESHADAQKAMRTVEASGADALVPLANEIGQGNTLADNWLRSAFEVAAANGFDLRKADLLAFFNDRDNNSRARRLVFETLTRDDKETRLQLLSSAIDDPSEEMRADAIRRVMKEAAAADSDDARRVLLEKALAAATVRNQVNDLAKKIEALGGEVDKQTHFGFLTEWHAVGPFDNKDMAGFDVEFGPEKVLPSAPDLDATYDGQLGEVKWEKLTTDADDGIVDLAEQIAPHKGALIYVTTTFESDGERPVELRLSTANAWKMWLNGKPLFEREEYHRGLHWDQYRVPATLQEGSNVIMIKVLQNEQDQSWAQRWSYSLRVTDPTGRGLGQVASK